MLRDIARFFGRPLLRRIDNRIDLVVAQRTATFSERIARLDEQIAATARHEGHSSGVPNLYVPALDSPELSPDAPFMQYSTCTAADFTHPRYHAICKMLTGRPVWHRKQWEWVFIIHHLIESGVIAEGRRGVGFGVGQEALPALFASLGATVTATDAPIGLSEGWNVTAQHSQSLEALRAPWIVPNEIFDRRISFQPCDMSNIDPSLRDFDFTWSSCCFEHLGSLKAGMDFVVNSVERCLKPGGVAVHTTEFNLSSNEQTEESGVTVLYRRRDIEELIALLRDRGHEVTSLSIGPTAHHLDTHVDVPPYSSSLHLKLKLGSYVSTSVGLIIKRGDS